MSDQLVRTEVVQEQGQWVVYLLVIDPSGIDRRRLCVQRSEREARLWASVIPRSAHRRGPAPENRQSPE